MTQKTVSEEEFLNVIEIITKKLAYKFKFGYHNYDDMKQQISIFALEGLKKYDHKRPLENFLWTHVRNRLVNYKRDNYQRPDKPCLSCPLYVKSSCTKFSNKNDCDLYAKWSSRNNVKKNLMHLTTIDEIKDYSNVFNNDDTNNVENNELLQLVEQHLTGDDRVTYLKMKNNVKVSRSEVSKLSQTLKQIITDHG
jgi:DNA-directed RNA polymerase specialized sigma24 family protein